MMNFNGLLGGRRPTFGLGGFWNTDPNAQISGLSQPFQNRVNSMWGRYAPSGTAMPGTFGAWETAIRGYMPTGGRTNDQGQPRPGGGGGGGGGSGGGGTGGDPRQFTWSFPQYSQTWAAPLASLPTPRPIPAPPAYSASNYSTGKDKKK